MRKNFIIQIVLVACLTVYGETAKEHSQQAEAAVSSFVSASATALSKADIALARSFVVRNGFKGNFGESIAEKSYIDTYLSKEGHWQSITPRSGPQGLDHLFIKTKNGVIKDVMVGESKFNTSALNKNTKDGIQMGEEWISKRLKRLAWRYSQISTLQEIGFGKPPLNSARKLCVVLQSGKKVYFWTEGYKWNFSGTEAELSEARLRASQYGEYFDRASSGLVKYRSRVFNIVPKGNDIEIRIYDAKTIANGNLHTAKPQGVLRFKEALLSKGAISETELAAQIQRKIGLSDADSIAYARKVLKEYDSRSLMGEFSLSKTVVANSAKATAIGVVIDATIQLIGTGEIEVSALGMNAFGVFLGTTVGQVTQIALTKPIAYNFIRNISGPLHCSTPMATSLLSSMAGGVASSAFLSYGAYFLGYSDLKTANRQMMIGTASTGAGAAFTCGAMWVATTWGTAGTGTAISSLSGAAASNAAMAWLGGGTVASGGGGMAAGAAVLTGGAVIVIAGVAAAGYYGFKMYDQHEDTIRICSELTCYQDDTTLDSVLGNDHRYVAMKPIIANQ